jgi:hypothetical protein
VRALPRKRKAPPKRGSHGNARLKGVRTSKTYLGRRSRSTVVLGEWFREVQPTSSEDPSPGEVWGWSQRKAGRDVGTERPTSAANLRASQACVDRSVLEGPVRGRLRGLTAIGRRSGSRAGAAPASLAARRRRRSATRADHRRPEHLHGHIIRPRRRTDGRAVVAVPARHIERPHAVRPHVAERHWLDRFFEVSGRHACGLRRLPPAWQDNGLADVESGHDISINSISASALPDANLISSIEDMMRLVQSYPTRALVPTPPPAWTKGY